MAIRPAELGTGPFDALARSPLLARLDAGERGRLLACAELVTVPARTRVHADADAGRHLDLLLDGAATLRRADLPLRRLGPGDHFGELAPLRTDHRGETVTAESALTIARISGRCWEGIERNDPALAA
jgi:uridine kinase